jgi:hypothetical protein
VRVKVTVTLSISRLLANVGHGRHAELPPHSLNASLGQERDVADNLGSAPLRVGYRVVGPPERLDERLIDKAIVEDEVRERVDRSAARAVDLPTVEGAPGDGAALVAEREVT